MKCDSKLEAGIDQFFAKVEYGNRDLACSVGIVMCYQEISTEKEILAEVELFMISHIVHCDFSLRKKNERWLYAHSSLHISISYLRQILQHLLHFFLFFCDSVLHLLLLVTWIPGDNRIPKHRARTATPYAVYDV